MTPNNLTSLAWWQQPKPPATPPVAQPTQPTLTPKQIILAAFKLEHVLTQGMLLDLCRQQGANISYPVLRSHLTQLQQQGEVRSSFATHIACLCWSITALPVQSRLFVHSKNSASTVCPDLSAALLFPLPRGSMTRTTVPPTTTIEHVPVGTQLNHLSTLSGLTCFEGEFVARLRAMHPSHISTRYRAVLAQIWARHGRAL